jgi:hypothetical protein
MDNVLVGTIARKHRALRDSLRRHADSTADPHEHVRQQLEVQWSQLAAECEAFCQAYNAAFGGERIYCQPHDDAIVVRSIDDPQETVTLTRTPPGSAHQSHIAAHRYSLHAPPADLPLSAEVVGDAVTLTIDGRLTTPAEAVLILLERFTDEIATGGIAP